MIELFDVRVFSQVVFYLFLLYNFGGNVKDSHQLKTLAVSQRNQEEVYLNPNSEKQSFFLQERMKIL